MQYYNRNDTIGALPLSVRAKGVLRNAGLDTVGRMLDFPEDALLGLRGMGRKSFAEVTTLRDLLTSGDTAEQFPCLGKNSSVPYTVGKSVPVFVGTDGMNHKDHLLYGFDLSSRSYKALYGFGIRYASELLDASEDDLMSVPRIGVSCAAEILDLMRKISFPLVTDTETFDVYRSDSLRSIAFELRSIYGHGILFWESRIFKLCAANSELGVDGIWIALYEDDAAKESLCDYLREKIKPVDRVVTREWLISQLPAHLQGRPEIVDSVLHQIEEEQRAKVAAVADHGAACMRAIDYARSLTNAQQRSVLVDRLAGKTLADVGVEMDGLCRERIRQIEKAALADRPNLYEDRYFQLFDRYYFTLDDFSLAFSEPASSYYYLSLVTQRSGCKNKNLDDALTDETISGQMRAAIARVCSKNCVFLDGEMVERTRASLAEWLFKHRCQDAITFEDFQDMYQQILFENGLAQERLIGKRGQSFKNTLLSSRNILFSFKNTFRYYDVDGTDFSGLISELDLEAYNGYEISTQLLFRKHPDVMQEYDIRNHYELHNLFRKIHALLPASVRLLKMPNIAVGKTDRHQQMLDLLLANIPISATELAKKYEELYGGDAKTYVAMYYAQFPQFYEDRGGINTGTVALGDEHVKRLREMLPNDLYLTSEAQVAFRRVLPDVPIETVFSRFNLKRIVFRLLDKYVVKSEYGSIGGLLLKKMPQDRIFSFREFHPEIVSLASFQTESMKLRTSYTVVETSPGYVCHINYLQKLGVSAEELNDYCEKVLAFVPDESFFTIYSLRRAGFAHPLDRLGFDDWFYASVIQMSSSKIKCRRIKTVKYLYKGEKNAIAIDFLRSVADLDKQITPAQFQEAIREKYGFDFPVSYLCHRYSPSTLWINRRTKKEGK